MLKNMLASGIFIIINQKVHLLFYQDSSVEFCWNWASGSGEEDFRNSVNEFRYLFGQVVALHWNKIDALCFVPSMVETGPVVLEKKIKMWKVYDNNDDNEDGDFDQKSSWAFKFQLQTCVPNNALCWKETPWVPTMAKAFLGKRNSSLFKWKTMPFYNWR